MAHIPGPRTKRWASLRTIILPTTAAKCCLFFSVFMGLLDCELLLKDENFIRFVSLAHSTITAAGKRYS